MENCKVLPENFADNLNRLSDDLLIHTDKVNDDIEIILYELRKISEEVVISII